MRTRKFLPLIAVAALLATGCSAAGSADDAPIKIGASLPITGDLASFGTIIETGYQEAVDQANAEGGIEIDGVKRQVELVVRDSTSDPNTVSQQTRELVLNEEVVGLLGSVSPMLTVPASNVADQVGVPLVATLTPVDAWRAANKDGWTYSWDLFWSESEMGELQFLASDLADTNKKIALFTDNEEDGVIQGELWNEKAASMGYEIVSHAEFPVGTTDYSTFIAEAKAAGADIVVAQMLPPDSFALWKQMSALDFSPKLAYCEKCAAQAAFQRELGDLAEGTATTDFWLRTDNADSVALTEKLEPEFGDNLDLSSVVISYTAAKVLLDAIRAAGSTDPDAINDAIAQTSGEYAIGSEISFGEDHAFAVTPITAQWRGTETVGIFNSRDGQMSDWQIPVAGLQ